MQCLSSIPDLLSVMGITDGGDNNHACKRPLSGAGTTDDLLHITCKDLPHFNPHWLHYHLRFRIVVVVKNRRRCERTHPIPRAEAELEVRASRLGPQIDHNPVRPDLILADLPGVAA